MNNSRAIFGLLTNCRSINLDGKPEYIVSAVLNREKAKKKKTQIFIGRQIDCFVITDSVRVQRVQICK